MFDEAELSSLRHNDILSSRVNEHFSKKLKTTKEKENVHELY